METNQQNKKVSFLLLTFHSFVPNVLMTVCKGNVLRMWSETFKSEELYFFVTYSETFTSSFVSQWISRPYELL
jgi:hypothetical protein